MVPVVRCVMRQSDNRNFTFPRRILRIRNDAPSLYPSAAVRCKDVGPGTARGYQRRRRLRVIQRADFLRRVPTAQLTADQATGHGAISSPPSGTGGLLPRQGADLTSRRPFVIAQPITWERGTPSKLGLRADTPEPRAALPDSPFAFCSSAV